jgi:hypothetical protein
VTASGASSQGLAAAKTSGRANGRHLPLSESDLRGERHDDPDLPPLHELGDERQNDAVGFDEPALPHSGHRR